MLNFFWLFSSNHIHDEPTSILHMRTVSYLATVIFPHDSITHDKFYIIVVSHTQLSLRSCNAWTRVTSSLQLTLFCGILSRCFIILSDIINCKNKVIWSVWCEFVFSVLLLNFLSNALHFTSSVWPNEICEVLCYYFWNNLLEKVQFLKWHRAV